MEGGGSQEGVWEGKGGSQEGGDGGGTVCVMFLCSGLNCKLPQGRVFVSFVPYAFLIPGKQFGTELPLHKSLSLEQVEDGEAKSSLRLWEILVYGRTDILGILGRLTDPRPLTVPGVMI